MRRELIFQSEGASDFFESTEVMRELLHQRYRLGREGRLSLLPTKNGVIIEAVRDKNACDTATLHEVVYASERIVRRGMYGSRGA